MDTPLSDEQVQVRIDALERVERELRRDEELATGADRRAEVAADAGRLHEIRVELDRLWDYLRQRRALRSAGQDPDQAQMRDAGTVERYLG
jgi:Protein of unknown function (DUF2630)